jgi:hypothetical protein
MFLELWRLGNRNEPQTGKTFSTSGMYEWSSDRIRQAAQRRGQVTVYSEENTSHKTEILMWVDLTSEVCEGCDALAPEAQKERIIRNFSSFS